MKIDRVPSMLKRAVDENTTKYEVQCDEWLSKSGAERNHSLYDSCNIVFRSVASARRQRGCDHGLSALQTLKKRRESVR